LDENNQVFTVTYQVTDGDGDTATNTLTINVNDDTPIKSPVGDTNSNGTISIIAPNSIQTYTPNLLDWSLGADGLGSVSLSNVSGNVTVSSVDGNIITLSLNDSAGNTVGTLQLVRNGDDSLSVLQRAGTVETDTLLTGDVTASGPSASKTINSSISGLIVTVTASGGSNLVNPSTQGWAVNNNQVDAGEAITFSFNQPVNNFSFATQGFTGSPSGGTVGLQVMVTYQGGLTESFDIESTSGQSTSVSSISGFNAGSLITSVSILSISGGSIGQDGNDGFRLNNVNVEKVTVIDPGDLNYAFTLNIVDGDGDSVSQDFAVSLLGSSGSAFSYGPVSLDLNGDGLVQYVDVGEGVVASLALDADQSLGLQTSWVGPLDGLLVYDYNADGFVTEAREVVFTMWGNDPNVATDMQALANYFDGDANGVKDGVLDANDVAWSYFGVWQDLNVDGVQDEGEFAYLADWDITSIALSYDADSTSDVAADGDVLVYGQMTVALTDGSTMLAEDVAFAVAPADATAVDPQVTEPLPVAESLELSVETTSEDVVIPEAEAVEAELVAVADLVNQFVAENVVSEETLVEYQQELVLTPDDSAFDANIDAGSSEPTAEAIVALDAADLSTPDSADDGLGHAADLVDDFSYTV